MRYMCVSLVGTTTTATRYCSSRRSSTDVLLCVPLAEKAGPQKRPVAGPRKGFMLEDVKLETITPIPYDILKEGVKT